MNGLTIGVLAFIALMAFIGYKRGFLRVLLSFGAIILAVAISSWISPACKEFLVENTPISTNIESGIQDSLMEKVKLEPDESKALDDLPIPVELREELQEKPNMILSEKVQWLAQSVTNIIMSAIAYVGVFLISFIILKLFSRLFRNVTRLPIVRQIDGVLGLALALLETGLILWIACIIVSALAGTEFGVSVLAQIHESPILSTIYNNNLLLSFTK